MSIEPESKRISYAKARGIIRDADVLLFRPTTLAGRIIAAGSGPYSHAGMVAWWHGRVMCLDTVQWRGGGATHLSALVEKYPGVIDVYRPIVPTEKEHAMKHRSRVELPTSDRQRLKRSKTVQVMVDLIGKKYGWLALAKAALVNARLTRRLWIMVFGATNDEPTGDEPPHCAMAVSLALQHGMELDPCPGLAPWATSPSDLGRSDKLEYLFTLQAVDRDE